MDTVATFADQLKQFGTAQLAGVSTHDLRASTVHLILATSFFTGAAIGMAKLSNIPQKNYLHVLRVFLEKQFGLNADHAEGLIESNARLYKRYVLVELIYNAGWLSASEWSKQPDSPCNELTLLLKKYRNLSMSGLNIEGTKEQAIAPQEADEMPQSIPTPEAVLAVPASHWKRKVSIMIIFMLAGVAAYAVFFPEQFSALVSALEPILKQLSALFSSLFSEESLAALHDKTRSLIP